MVPACGLIREIFYTESVQTHWRQTTVGEHGYLVLEDLPLEAGQPVEVLVIPKNVGLEMTGDRSLRGSVFEYHEPFESVAGEDWEALR